MNIHPVPSSSLAVVIDAVGTHELRETQVPVLADDEVMVKVAYVGVCATDLEVMEGELTYYRNGTAFYPIVPGHEYSGVVVQAGPHVTGIAVGDHVVGECAMGCGACEWCDRGEYFRCARRTEVGVVNKDGAYARYMSLPASYAHKLPDGLTLRRAAVIEPTAVCVKATGKLRAEPGKRVCIFGAGSIGNLCTQILRAQGIEVTVVDRDPARLALLDRYGATTTTTLDDLSSFDYLLEATGNAALIPALIERSKPSVRIVLMGIPYLDPVEVSFASFPANEKEMLGSIASHYDDWEEAIRLVSEGVINLDDHIGEILPLESYAQAWQWQRERAHLKVLLSTNQDLRDA